MKSMYAIFIWIKNDYSHPLSLFFLNKIGVCSSLLSALCAEEAAQQLSAHFLCIEGGWYLVL